MTDNNDLVTSATSETELRLALALLHERETALITKLDATVKKSIDFNRDLDRLDGLCAGLGMQLVAARGIHTVMLSSTGDTAQRLSTMVRSLDLEKGRVEATLVVVEQVTELKACIAGLVGSMGASQDWETAAGYLSRASRIPEEVTRGGFALAVVPSIETPEPPWTTIQTARKSLCALFLGKFDAAAKQGDGTKVARLFKLFPVIGEEDAGLDAYGRYVCQGIADAARSALKGSHRDHGSQSHLLYANNLIKMFEHIMHIINSHSGLIERHYGAGKVVKVIERLQVEADIQGGILLDVWHDERAVARTVTGLKSYPFSLLLQNMMPAQKGLGSVLGESSPAPRGTTGSEQGLDELEVDVKKIEWLFREITAMLMGWSHYKRSIAGQYQVVLTQNGSFSPPNFIYLSNLHNKISEKLTKPYQTIAIFLFRRSVEKAFEMNTAPRGLSLRNPCGGSPPFILQAADDIMYVLDNILQHILSTGNREVVISITLAIGRILESDFIGIIHGRMRGDCHPRPPVQGGIPAEEKVINFMVLINTLDTAKEYLERISHSRGSLSNTHGPEPVVLSPEALKESFPFDRDAELVANALHGLNRALSPKATELLNDGVRALLDEVLWPGTMSILTNSFQDANYDVSESGDLDGDDEIGEPALGVSDRFEDGWLALTRPLEHILTPRTYAALVSLTSNKLARTLEKRAWSYSGRVTALGGLRLERDFSGIISAVAKGDYAFREPLARVKEILAIANMEDDEWNEVVSERVLSGPGTNSLLNDEETAKARKFVRR